MVSRGVAWVVVLGALLALWEGSLSFGFVSPAALAHPMEVLAALPRVLAPRENLPDVWATISKSIMAFALSIPLGILCGFCVFHARAARQPMEAVLDFVRSIPATALVPVFLIIWGIGDSTKVAVGTFSSALVICLSTVTGLHSRSTSRLGVARTLGLSGLRHALYVDLPEAAPQIALGMRTGISLALILVVVGEMLIGSNRGLGKVIADMRYTDDTPRLYASLLITGVIGLAFNLMIAFLEKRLLHWKGR